MLVSSCMAMPNKQPFELPVNVNGKELTLPAGFVQWTYGYRILVTVNDQEIFFEPDEEGQFRALTMDSSGKAPDLNLVQAIAAALEKHLRG